MVKMVYYSQSGVMWWKKIPVIHRQEPLWTVFSFVVHIKRLFIYKNFEKLNNCSLRCKPFRSDVLSQPTEKKNPTTSVLWKTTFAAPMNAFLAQQCAMNDPLLETALSEASLVVVPPGQNRNPHRLTVRVCAQCMNKNEVS